MTIINGRQTVSHQVTYPIEVVGIALGKFKIPPIEIKVGDQVYRTPERVLEVVKNITGKNFGTLTVRDVFPTLDGFVAGMVAGGSVSWRSTTALIRWMEEEGKASGFLKSQDWPNMDYYRMMTVGGQEARDFERCQGEFAEFFATKTKAEIYAHAVSDKILLAPVNDMRDLLENEHLEFREFWQQVHQPGMDATFAFPGPYIKMSETPIEYLRSVPLIGEHNAEVYGEIGVTAKDLERLRETGVV